MKIIFSGFGGIFMKILILISIFFCLLGYSDSSRIVGCNALDGAYQGSADFIFNNFSPFGQTYDVNIASSSSEILVQIKEREGENVLCTQFSDPRRPRARAAVPESENSPPIERQSSEQVSSESLLIRAGNFNHRGFINIVTSISFAHVYRANADGSRSRSCIARKLQAAFEADYVEMRIYRRNARAKNFSDLSQECNALPIAYRF